MLNYIKRSRKTGHSLFTEYELILYLNAAENLAQGKIKDVTRSAARQ